MSGPSGGQRRRAEELLQQMRAARDLAAVAHRGAREAFAAVQAVHAERSDSTAAVHELHTRAQEVRDAAAEVHRLAAELRGLHGETSSRDGHSAEERTVRP
jgi:uncharacterized coiled-coil DUF342 family protein